MWVRHGVERTNGLGVFVQDEEISLILLLHQSAEVLLLASAVMIVKRGGGKKAFQIRNVPQVISVANLVASSTKQSNTLSEVNTEGGLEELEGLEGVLLVNKLQLSGKLGLQSLKDSNKQFVHHIQHL